MKNVSSFESGLIEKLQRCDFFSGNSENFFQLAAKNSARVCGTHKSPPPLVSIVITTYKRPDWLKLALESALDQKDFSDYQIIIVDNEGTPLDEETDTSRLVCSYSDERILYYRNFPTVYQRTQTAVSLVRSKWFCILHDDDFLATNHLKIMTNALRDHPEILYLACTAQSFSSEDAAEILEKAQTSAQTPSRLLAYPAKSACVGCYPGWLGALISKEHYVNMGGMYGDPPLATSINDYIMVLKFMGRHGAVYRCAGEPSYFYRKSMAQDSAIEGAWLKAYVSEYFLYEYMAKKYHPICFFFWKYIGSLIIYEKIAEKTHHNWLRNKPFDFPALCAATGVPSRDLGGKRFALEKRLLSYIRGYYHYGFWSQVFWVLAAPWRRLRRLFGMSAACRDI